jgi:hypothetical protein
MTSTVVVDSCRECGGWGATRTHRWLCSGCTAWRESYPQVGVCRTCSRAGVHLDDDGSCRSCRKQRTWMARQLGCRVDHVTPEQANAQGHQLFFAIAGMFYAPNGTRPYQKKTVPPDLSLLRPVNFQQLVLLDVPRDLHRGMVLGFPTPPLPELEAALHQFVREHAAAHGWKRSKVEAVQRGIRILLGIQDTPGAAIRRSDVMLLTRIKRSAAVVADVLAAAGMLDDDRTPAIVRWFPTQIAGLPDPMQQELRIWFHVMREGSTTPPRRRPRADTTIGTQLRYAVPALQQWAKAGHSSLREIGRDDVLGVLPPTGGPRALTVQSLRSIFRILKTRKQVFVNPTARISVPKPEPPAHAPLDLVVLRQALDSTDPTAAVLAAFLAFHAVRLRQLAQLRLTDVRDHRLHIEGQVVLLAEPVRDRLQAYLDFRARSWPASPNPYLLLHVRNAGTLRHVSPYWIRHKLPIAGQFIRQDRILDEAHATGGDVRALCDMFGLSIPTAARYVSLPDRIDNPRWITPPVIR